MTAASIEDFWIGDPMGGIRAVVSVVPKALLGAHRTNLGRFVDVSRHVAPRGRPSPGAGSRWGAPRRWHGTRWWTSVGAPRSAAVERFDAVDAGVTPVPKLDDTPVHPIFS